MLTLLEVEAKARVADFDGIEEAIAGLGGVFDGEEVQLDTYFNHPLRDFAESDEALRIRRVGGSCFVTYKGAKIDDLTKTREEIELEVLAGFDKIKSLFLSLGFVEVLTVEKRRRYFRCGGFVVMLDDVVGLGRFVEVEKQGDDYELLEVLGFLRSLGVDDECFERRSYLELLLDGGSL